MSTKNQPPRKPAQADKKPQTRQPDDLPPEAGNAEDVKGGIMNPMR